MLFNRLININNIRSSLFLFGPRMVGKTSILKVLKCRQFISLLDSQKELEYQRDESLLWQQIQHFDSGDLVIIDEIQKAPRLLDTVQRGIDDLGLRFILSGSSARKLKRSGANLLGGRAVERHLYPLSFSEISSRLDLSSILSYGSLPKVATLIEEGHDGAKNEAREILMAYCSLYIKEEVQAEALVRNVETFTRFLYVAAQSHGDTIEYANIEKTAKVPATTVKEYFSILEDTLIGVFLWPFDRSERRKARPKFYFFDPGVVRGLQNRIVDPPTGQELGKLFEAWFVLEVKKISDYFHKSFELSFWRDGDHEIDLLIRRGSKALMAIEVKSGLSGEISETTLRKFRKNFPDVELVIASMQDTIPRMTNLGIEILPFALVLERISKI